MGKHEFRCSQCDNKITVETEKEEDKLKKIKGGMWWPLLSIQEDEIWSEETESGVGVRCKCGKFVFVYNFTSDAHHIEVTDTLKEGQMLAVFCGICNQSFISLEMICPKCSTQY